MASPDGDIEIYDNATGCNSPEEVLDSCDVIPDVNEMIQEGSFTIYPNPVKEALVISYHLTQSSTVSIAIHDLSGRLISTMVNENQHQGEQMLFYEIAGLKPGIYFCTFKTNDPACVGQTWKMIKLEYYMGF